MLQMGNGFAAAAQVFLNVDAEAALRHAAANQLGQAALIGTFVGGVAHSGIHDTPQLNFAGSGLGQRSAHATCRHRGHNYGFHFHLHWFVSLAFSHKMQIHFKKHTRSKNNLVVFCLRWKALGFRTCIKLWQKKIPICACCNAAKTTKPAQGGLG